MRTLKILFKIVSAVVFASVGLVLGSTILLDLGDHIPKGQHATFVSGAVVSFVFVAAAFYPIWWPKMVRVIDQTSHRRATRYQLCENNIKNGLWDFITHIVKKASQKGDEWERKKLNLLTALGAYFQLNGGFGDLDLVGTVERVCGDVCGSRRDLVKDIRAYFKRLEMPQLSRDGFTLVIVVLPLEGDATEQEFNYISPVVRR